MQMKDSLGCNWFKRRCASSACFYCSSPGTCFSLSLSRRFQYTQIMADVNEWMRERGEERKEGRESPFSVWSFQVHAERKRDVCKITRSYEVDWRWWWNWMLCPFACEGDYSAPPHTPSSLPPAPPQHPEIKTNKNISSHLRTSLTLIFWMNFFFYFSSFFIHLSTLWCLGRGFVLKV